MNRIIQRILLFLFLIINVLFVDKYASRITEYHWFVSLTYLIVGALIVWIVIKKLMSSIHASKWLMVIGLSFLLLAIVLQYFVDPLSLQVDRWSAIHNFLNGMLAGEYPYGQQTHLGGYGSPFPVWQVLHLPFYFLGNVALSIFVVVLAFIGTLYYIYSNKVALMATILLVISPAFWYEIVVRSDLITNIMLMAVLVEWLSYKRIKLGDYPGLVGILSGLVLSTRLIALIPICVLYGYEFLRVDWRKQCVFLLTTILTAVTTFLPFLFWEGSTLLFFEYNPFVLQTRQGSWIVLFVFAMIAIAMTIYLKENKTYRNALTGMILNVLVVMAFVEKMWQQNLWDALYSSAFDITYLTIGLPFYIAHLSCDLGKNRTYP